MAYQDGEVSPSSTPIDKAATKIEVICLSSSSSSDSSTYSSYEIYASDDNSSPLRPVLIAKKPIHMQALEKSEDCFILDFDPSEPLQLSKLSISEEAEQFDDIIVVAEKGQVATRDYPHSRHLCVKYPFKDSEKELHCELCYCYVCDSPAPCVDWTRLLLPHCRATEEGYHWELKRMEKKEKMKGGVA